MTPEQKEIEDGQEDDYHIYMIQKKAIIREIRGSRGGIMVRQVIQQLNALEMVMDRLEAKLKKAKVTTKAKK
tara:strand:+ start:375 stop:590 length:216 start_codon:yes stop_codon:yes gene_type:complete